MKNNINKIDKVHNLKLVNQLAGNVKLPLRFKGMSLDEIIEKAKHEHFGKKINTH